MSNLSSLSSIRTMLQTSSIVWQSVSLTDELQIHLEYDIQRSLLNIFVKNTDDNKYLPCCINVLLNPSRECQKIANSNINLLTPSELQQEYVNEDEDEDNEPKIRYELSTTYVYELTDENENIDQIECSQTRIASSSSSSSSSSFCFDEQTTDNDDGYSTHSLDDIEQQHQQPLAIPSSKLIVPFFSSPHHYYYYSEQYVSPIRRLIEQLTWLSPFKKTMHEMMRMNHLFD